MTNSHPVVHVHPLSYTTDATVTGRPTEKACLVSTSKVYNDLEIFYLNLCNVLTWHHNKPNEAACHVHLQGRCGRCFRGCLGCGLYSVWGGWTVLVGLGQYDVTFLRIISGRSEGQTRVIYVIGALKVAVKHSRISDIDLELLVQ